MDDSAVSRGHRLQGDTAIGLGHAGSDLGRHIAQGVFPALSVVFHIQHHPDIFSQPLSHDERHQELESLESLPSPANEQPRILPSQVNDRAAAFRVVGRAQGAGDVDSGGLQDPAHGCRGQRGCGLLSGVGDCGRPAAAAQGRNTDSRQFRSDAEESGLPPT